jgi:hypothetical protein
MKINNNSIPGLFKFTLGVTFEVGDIILFDKPIPKLRIVTTEFESKFNPNKISESEYQTKVARDYCKYYDEVSKGYDSLTPDSTALIRTCDMFSYLKSLPSQCTDSYIEPVTMSLSEMHKTGTWLLVKGIEDLPDNYVPSDIATIRISVTRNNVVLQEILDYKKTSYYFRSFEIEGTEPDKSTKVRDITPWTNLNQVQEANEVIKSYQELKSAYELKLRTLELITEDIDKAARLVPNSSWSSLSNVITLPEASQWLCMLKITVDGVTYQSTFQVSSDNVEGTIFDETRAFRVVKGDSNKIIIETTGVLNTSDLSNSKIYKLQNV